MSRPEATPERHPSKATPQKPLSPATVSVAGLISRRLREATFSLLRFDAQAVPV